MNDTIPLRTRRLTPEEVLQRFRFGTDDDYVTADSQVDDYAVLFLDDPLLFGSDKLGQLRQLALEQFGVRIDTWEESWHRLARWTMREFCERIAAESEAVVPQPVTVLGRPCLSAGTFLAVRTLLARAGANVGTLAPSSPVGPFLMQCPEVFRCDVSLLAAEPLPIDVKKCAAAWNSCLLLIAGISAFVMAVAGTVMLSALWQASVFNATVAGICFLAALWTIVHSYQLSQRLTRQIEITGVHDFRDLVDTLLGRPLRRRAAPNPGSSS